MIILSSLAVGCLCMTDKMSLKEFAGLQAGMFALGLIAELFYRYL